MHSNTHSQKYPFHHLLVPAFLSLLPSSAFSQQWKELYNPLEVRNIYLTIDSGDWSSVINDQPTEGGSASQTRGDGQNSLAEFI